MSVMFREHALRTHYGVTYLTEVFDFLVLVFETENFPRHLISYRPSCGSPIQVFIIILRVIIVIVVRTRHRLLLGQVLLGTFFPGMGRGWRLQKFENLHQFVIY